ncbi:MAG: ribosome silencing factor [Sphingobacteriaceae bacterium]
MIKNKGISESTYIAELAVHGIQEKKGNNIVRLDLRNLHSSVTDYFVVCHADSSTQIRAIVDSIEKEVYKGLQLDPWHREGFENAEWVIIDYFDVVVHIFRTDKRDFYAIEDLWGDAEVKNYKSA